MAEQRHVASLYDISAVTLDAIEFTDMVDMTTSTPVRRCAADPDWPWNPPAIVAALVAGDDVDIENAPVRNLAQTVQQRLATQWLEFKSHCRPVAVAPGVAIDERGFRDSDRFDHSDGGVLQYDADGQKIPRLPAWYWIRTRAFWPDLSELMLFWLCVPVSTAGLERAFSFQTLVDQDTRRRITTRGHMRDDMLAHVHRPWFDDRLVETLPV
jgi:hypothetical protein